MIYILPFDSHHATLALAGGKGVNLARLTQAGFPVPSGFLVVTEAYRRYLQVNDLEPVISAALKGLDAQDPQALEAASQTIRSRFESGYLPADLAAALREAYFSLGKPPVAVRSSATTEDLPDFSFAGQQDTYLNVIGTDELLRAVVRCWSSLWTARAIGYRARNEIDQGQTALAVVVQKMVAAEASGVLFTANPLTGLRTETVIDATLGLGEALVSGQVEPDHYVVDADGKIQARELGAKAIAMHAREEGGLATEQVSAGNVQALPDEAIRALARIGREVETFYRFPQDIEFAWTGEELYLLQTRPVTSLYPLPEDLPPEPVRILFSFGAVQGMLEPITPLGQDVIRLIMAGGASLFGIDLRHGEVKFLKTAGERLWGDITGALQNPLGFRLIQGFFPLVLPEIGGAVDETARDPNLRAGRGRLKLSTIRALLRFLLPLAGNVIRNYRKPEERRERILREARAWLDQFELQADQAETLRERVDLLMRIREAFPVFAPSFVSAIATAMSALNGFGVVTASAQEGAGEHENRINRAAMAIGRGLPHNATTEMDLALWETACTIQADPQGGRIFGEQTAEELSAAYLAGQLPAAVQGAIEAFLARYGMRGVGEIDIGRPRWRENPIQVMHSLSSYLHIPSEAAPTEVFTRGRRESEAAVARILERGGLKARIAAGLARRYRAMGGLRESPKFSIVQMMGPVRAKLLESGEDLAAEGILAQAGDLFFLTLDELDALADAVEAGRSPAVAAKIAARREAYRREQARRQVPLLLFSDGRMLYEDLNGRTTGTAVEGVLTGSPVSPGVVEGPVRLVFDPAGTHLNPGEILVCRGTDPAWTPLFLTAGGLVMEVGGMMTHGSVVAREYGIPAVVGIHDATTRLHTGQQVRVNGSTGEVIILGGD